MSLQTHTNESRGAKIAPREKDFHACNNNERERDTRDSHFPIPSPPLFRLFFFLFPSTTTKYSDALHDCGSSHNAPRDLFPSTFRPRFPISSFRLFPPFFPPGDLRGDLEWRGVTGWREKTDKIGERERETRDREKGQSIISPLSIRLSLSSFFPSFRFFFLSIFIFFLFFFLRAKSLGRATVTQASNTEEPFIHRNDPRGANQTRRLTLNTQ